jgi:dienelactone hydrolase
VRRIHGGFTTFRALVIEKRIKAAAAIISSPYWDDMPQGVAIADDPESRQALEEIARGCSPSLFPERFPPRPLLIQIGRQDQHYNVDRVIEFAEQLRNDFYQEEPEKVKLIVHEGTGHEFTPEMWDNALAWFKKYL